MQREEKLLDAALDTLIQRVNDIKTSLVMTLAKLEHEHETLGWPSVLDSYTLLSGQINTLLRVLKNDKTPAMRNLVLLPLLLSQERDEELAKSTDSRLTSFSHDVAPHYLRTKAEPEVEQRQAILETKACQMNMDMVQKQVNTMNKMMNHALDMVSSAKEEWESESTSRASTAQTSSLADTHMLVAAVGGGKGLKPSMMTRPGPPGPMPTPQQQQMASMGKAPSTIKTNIKAGGQMHPYAR